MIRIKNRVHRVTVNSALYAVRKVIAVILRNLNCIAIAENVANAKAKAPFVELPAGRNIKLLKPVFATVVNVWADSRIQ